MTKLQKKLRKRAGICRSHGAEFKSEFANRHCKKCNCPINAHGLPIIVYEKDRK